MPSVQELKSKNARAVQEKHLDLISKYTSNYSSVESLHKLAKSQILDDVTSQLQLNEEGKTRVLVYLSDYANLFRFLRRSRYDQDQALSLLNATVLWRMRTDLDLLSLSSLNPLYVTPPPPNPPLFWVNSGFRDFYGRPCGVISLRSVERTAENTLDQLKEYIVACMEIMRRYIADLYRSSSSQQQDDDATVLQAAIAVDLASSGMANLELELLPFLLDLLKNHVPGMVGAVYVLNYGWVHAGMWAVIKRVLPQQALAKIFFPSHDEMRQHFDGKNLPKCYGGELDISVESASNDVLKKYGRPSRVSNAASVGTPPHSPGVARHMSRTNSYDSIYEVFYSADSTPWASRAVTPRHSEPSTPRGDNPAGPGGLKMTPSAARKLKHLQMSRGDLSSAAEHGNRARSDSNPRIVDGRAIGLSVNVAGTGSSSPFVTPSMTPLGPLSPRMMRMRSGAERHVRFSTENGSQPDRSSSPRRRVGATSNFTLYLPEDEDAILPSESEDSDASGKDGELPPTAVESSPSSSGLFNRLRRLSETRFASSKDADSTTTSDSDNTAVADGTIMYIEPPSSPHLQVPHLDEPPLQHHIPHHFLSHRTRRSARDGLVSPYNVNNPFFGYPAYNPPPLTSATFKLNRTPTPQHLHSRRRKRDLLRTLTYLFVLRILAVHRRLRWRMSLVAREVARVVKNGGGDGQGETDGGEEFWRSLDKRRLNAEPENAKRGSGKRDGRGSALVSAVRKVMGAMVLVMLLRPEWRQRTLVRVYNVIVGGRREDEGEVLNWDEWERGPAATVAKGRSYSGLHLRQKLGLTSTATSSPGPIVSTAAAGGSGSGKAGRGRVNPLAVAGGLISAASLSYLLYTYLSSSSSSSSGSGNDDDDDDVSRRKPNLKPPSSSSSRIRPSLSLTLSPSFTRTPSSITNLRTLLNLISPLFVIHLILPGDEACDISTSIASLSTSLGPIPDFDSRRILEYTQSGGRFALSRALACDCHVEIALPESAAQPQAEAGEVEVVAELGKIRRSCGLVVYASLGGGTGVLDELRRLGETEGREAPNGMRVFDLGVDDGAMWQDLGERLGDLRQGWK
ncbi:uncharacterized protein UTRI_04627_B [Ustilago trichophora]|uniref:CRAL-TRIO domain-containing protein n=1 Tax=Ustilago trichophora TaxID=86804 RepID=A0A5C3ECS3_9BASI|nr:uncharacterized protein UTRI_04627_B [Ustilago trichophora]